jgi:hypothetical protein
MYVVLWDEIADQYKTVPQNSSIKGWNARWFYTENVEESIWADIDSMGKPNANWTARPCSEEMQHVEELLEILAQTSRWGWHDAKLH